VLLLLPKKQQTSKKRKEGMNNNKGSRVDGGATSLALHLAETLLFPTIKPNGEEGGSQHTNAKAAMKLKLSFIGALLVLFLTWTYNVEADGTTAACPPWSYFGTNGPQNWGYLCPAYATCATG